MMPFFDDDEFFGDLLLMGAAGGGKAVEATATGNPLTFQTDLARPLKSLLIPFTPVQSGTGDPSPQNIRSILPWNGLKVWNGGGNLFSPIQKGIGLDAGNGREKQADTEAATDYIPVNFMKNASYVWTGMSNKLMASAYAYNSDNVFLGRTSSAVRSSLTLTKSSFTYGTPQGTGEIAYLRFKEAEGSTGQSIDLVDDCDYMLNVGSSALPYEPYAPITETEIPFASPVYGGTLDVVSGVLTVEWTKTSSTWTDCEPGSVTPETGLRSGHLDFTESVVQCVNGVDYGKNTFCNVCGKIIWGNASYTPSHYYINSQGRVWIAMPQDTPNDTVIEVYAKLATPVEIQLTPQQITALIGDNTIWSDADGQMTAVFLKKG